MDFHNVNLPKFMEVFAIGRPEFTTSCVLSKSGREVRSLDKNSPCRKYILRDCRLSVEQFHQFNSFFKARAGRRFAFRFRDLADYKVVKQLLAKGDGKIKEFQFYRLYDDLVAPCRYKITKLAKNSVKLFIENIEVKPDKINLDNGIITFKNPVAKNKMLLASFEFDVPVRFLNDSFDYKFCSDGSVEILNLELKEICE